jgi:hypothetical protein
MAIDPNITFFDSFTARHDVVRALSAAAVIHSAQDRVDLEGVIQINSSYIRANRLDRSGCSGVDVLNQIESVQVEHLSGDNSAFVHEADLARGDYGSYL